MSKSVSNFPPAGRAITQEEEEQLVAEMQRTIQSSHLFKSLDASGRQKVIDSGYVCSFNPDAIIVEQDQSGDTMYLLLTGKVRVVAKSPSGRHVHLADLGPGACFGEVAVLTGKPRTATVMASGPVSCVAFEKHRIERILAEFPKVHEVLLTIVEGRARSTVDRFLRASSTAIPKVE